VVIALGEEVADPEPKMRGLEVVRVHWEVGEPRSKRTKLVKCLSWAIWMYLVVLC
jgi:hypothetical protein